MKRFLVFTFMFIFLANTTVVSAWAQFCMHDMSAPVSDTEIASQNGTPPCHQTENTKQSDNQNQLCDGSCLCASLSNNMPSLIRNSDHIRLPVTAKQLFIFDKYTLKSASQIPPKRPPKQIS